MRHRFAQSLDTNGYCDGHEWLEVCSEGEQGEDGEPAFPVYATPRPYIPQDIREAVEENEALRKENEQLCQEIKVLQKRIRNLWSLIRDDAFANTFQSMGQYREALLKELPEYQANHDFQTKEIFIVWSNTDLTEGRGNEIPVAYCEKQATAKRLAKKKGVMGSDASVKPYKSIFHDGTWVAPFDMTPSTREDDEAQKKIDAYNKAAEKARAAGLSDFDLALLKGGTA